MLHKTIFLQLRISCFATVTTLHAATNLVCNAAEGAFHAHFFLQLSRVTVLCGMAIDFDFDLWILMAFERQPFIRTGKGLKLETKATHHIQLTH